MLLIFLYDSPSVNGRIVQSMALIVGRRRHMMQCNQLFRGVRRITHEAKIILITRHLRNVSGYMNRILITLELSVLKVSFNRGKRVFATGLKIVCSI